MAETHLIQAQALLEDVTADATSNRIEPRGIDRVFHAFATGTGSIAVTVTIDGSMDGLNWLTLGTIALSGTDADADAFTSATAWRYVRAVASSFSGTGTAVTVWMGSY